ncbi:Bax inhibitor-1/YccA family protein [Actinocorallia lasiicapitis]
MESRNPVFRSIGRDAQQGQAPSPQQLQDMYNAPAYAPPAERTMTLDDVVVRGFMTLGTLVLTGAVAWFLDLPIGIGIVAALIGFGIGLYLSFSGKASAPLTLGYAVFYGIAVGIISHAYENVYNGVVFQAVVGTILAFAGVLTVYSLRVIRVTPKMVRFGVAASIGLLGLIILNMVIGLFSDGGIGIRENGPIGIVFSVVMILAGCFFLLLDFDMIERGVAGGLPEKYSWACAFAITSTLVLIYLELLRLISILNSD